MVDSLFVMLYNVYNMRGTLTNQRALSSSGRATVLQAVGERFESARVHHICRAVVKWYNSRLITFSWTFKSSLRNQYTKFLAVIAQLVERLICNQDVRGSSPRGGTKFKKWSGARVVQGNGLQIHKAVSSNLTLTSNNAGVAKW